MWGPQKIYTQPSSEYEASMHPLLSHTRQHFLNMRGYLAIGDPPTWKHVPMLKKALAWWLWGFAGGRALSESGSQFLFNN